MGFKSLELMLSSMRLA